LKNNQKEYIKETRNRYETLGEREKKIVLQSLTMKTEKIFMKLPEEKLPTEADRERRRAQLARLHKNK